MSLLSRCAAITLVLSCTACSGIPVSEPAVDTVSYPSGCIDGCQQGNTQEDTAKTQPAEKNQEILRPVRAAVYWTLSTACIPSTDAAPPSVKPALERPLPFE